VYEVKSASSDAPRPSWLSRHVFRTTAGDSWHTDIERVNPVIPWNFYSVFLSQQTHRIFCQLNLISSRNIRLPVHKLLDLSLP
jgi:hypothetical protein